MRRQINMAPWTPEELDREAAPPGILLAAVAREEVEWLWYPRIPLGKLSILEGDPDVGKSALAYDLAARVSTGAPMPFETDGKRHEPAGVVVVACEDGLGDTVRPRLEAAGADLNRILALRVETPGEVPDLPELGRLPEAIDRVKAKVVILDPLLGLIGQESNAHVDQDIRHALQPLLSLLAERKVAGIGIRHLNKTREANPKYRGGGSIALTAVARSVALASIDPTDETRRILARVKGNLAPPWPSIAYRLKSSSDGVLPPLGALGVLREAGALGALRVEWLGTHDLSAEDILAAARSDARLSSEAEVTAWLKGALARGPWESHAMKSAAREAGFADRTVDRARNALDLLAKKSGFGGWTVELQPKTPAFVEGRQGRQPLEDRQSSRTFIEDDL